MTCWVHPQPPASPGKQHGGPWLLAKSHTLWRNIIGKQVRMRCAMLNFLPGSFSTSRHTPLMFAPSGRPLASLRCHWSPCAAFLLHPLEVFPPLFRCPLPHARHRCGYIFHPVVCLEDKGSGHSIHGVPDLSERVGEEMEGGHRPILGPMIFEPKAPILHLSGAHLSSQVEDIST